MTQFQLESLFVVGMAGLLGLVIMESFQWTMLNLLQFQIPFILWENNLLIWVLPPFLLVLGFLAGLYPSFYLTAFRPVQVLTGKTRTGLAGLSLRNSLVIFQFTMAIMLLASTIVVYQQFQFFLNKDLGFDKSNLLLINQAEKLGNHLEAYKDELAKYPEIISASISMTIPGRGTYEDLFSKEGSDVQVPIAMLKVDEDFLKTWELKMSAGRYFEEGRISDLKGAILNETAAKLLGWESDESVGNRIVYTGNDLGPMEVIGVVRDFHYQSLRDNIAPLVMLNIDAPLWGDQRVLAVKYHGAKTQSLVNKLGDSWANRVEATPFQFSFFKEEWEHQYRSESQLGSLFGFFTILAMTIAVIGLIGLVSFSVEQRMKEISIRKVPGADCYVISKIIKPTLLCPPTNWHGQY